MEYTFTSSSPARTFAFGKRLGGRLPPGAVIALIGELGCGKTLFTRGLSSGMGVPDKTVNSPTFVLVNEYRGSVPIFHMDLYRLNSLADGFEIGIMDYLRRGREGVIIVEWAEKIASLLPLNCLSINFEVTGPRSRRLVLSTRNDKLANVVSEAARE